MADWYYASGGQQLGPVSLESLQGMARSGQLGPDDLVWTNGMAEWYFASNVAALPGQFAPATSPAGGETYRQDFAPQSPVAPPGEPYPYSQQPAPGPYAPGYPAPVGILGYGLRTYRETQPTYAGFWLRFCAAMIDGVITSIPGWVIAGTWAITAIEPGVGVRLATDGLSLVVGWLYEALFTSSAYQATPGKLLLGIRVTDVAGERISFARATGRHFAKIISAIILLIGYIMAAFTERKQALHDLMAGTLVVKK